MGELASIVLKKKGNITHYQPTGFSGPISEVRPVKKTAHKANPQIEPAPYEVLRDKATHAFQWSQGTATCSCGRWTLWGAGSVESAKRNHALHRANLPESEPAVGQWSGKDQG